jgi:hypothetical protein
MANKSGKLGTHLIYSIPLFFQKKLVPFGGVYWSIILLGDKFNIGILFLKFF